jgi:hypothetical protein
MKRHRFYIINQIGLHQFILSPMLIILSIAIFLFSQTNLIPSSVHVSGYTRSNGTYVNSYNRRPPGSVEHDKPYQILNYISFGSFVLGIIWLVLLIREIHRSNHIDLFLKTIIWRSNYPTRPSFVPLPEFYKKARKDWYCSRCSSLIKIGMLYYHCEYSSKYIGNRYCNKCYEELKVLYKEYLIKLDEYYKECNFVANDRINQLSEAYRKKFKEELTSPENYISR